MEGTIGEHGRSKQNYQYCSMRYECKKRRGLTIRPINIVEKRKGYF